MGYYVAGPMKGKGADLVSQHGAREIPKPASFADIPAGMSLVVVVDNGPFEAVGYVYNPAEFEVFVTGDPGDHRPRRFYLMGENLCHQLCNYHRR